MCTSTIREIKRQSTRKNNALNSNYAPHCTTRRLKKLGPNGLELGILQSYRRPLRTIRNSFILIPTCLRVSKALHVMLT